MKRWLAVGGLAAFGILVGVACENGQGKSGEPPPQPSGKPPGEGIFWGDLGNHAQSAKLRGDKLEQYPFFFGKVDAKGVLETTVAQDPDKPNELQIVGIDTKGNPKTLTLTRKGADQCFPAELFDGATLPLYMVSDGFCQNSKVELADETDDLRYCPKRMSIDEKKAAFAYLNGLAVAVPGAWDLSGKYHEPASPPENFVTLSCISGVIAKCTHWGYWAGMKTKKREDLKPYLQACVHAARAAYGASVSGVGAPTAAAFTCGGTVVDIFDNLSPPIQPPKTGTDLKSLESYWSQDGVSCLAQTRYGCADRYFKAGEKDCSTASGLIGVRGETKPPPPSNNCPGIDENACGDE